MKRALLLLAFCGAFIPAVSFAGEGTQTKLESSLERKDVVITTEWKDLGDVCAEPGGDCIRFTAATVSLEDGKKTKGLRIELTTGGERPKSAAALIDGDELERLSVAITDMLNIAETWKDTNKEYSEVFFAAKGFFEIGFYQKGLERKAFAAAASDRLAKLQILLKNLDKLKDVKKKIDDGIRTLKEK
ncbi:MAG: hypothetical protein HY884_10100 [Deltaproteobacteria bacterium]|nr:hypothetical protein [Deltaproteobacteria bacterium]